MRGDKPTTGSLVVHIQQLRHLTRAMAGPGGDLLAAALDRLEAIVEDVALAAAGPGGAGPGRSGDGPARGTARYYRHLWAASPDPLLVTDTMGVIVEGNQAAGALLGMRGEALVGKPLVLYVDPADRHGFHSQLAQVRTGQDVIGWRLELRPRHAPPASVSVRVAPSPARTVQWALRPSGAWRSHDDLARALAAEQEASALLRTRAELQGEVAARAWHDLAPGRAGREQCDGWVARVRRDLAAVAVRGRPPQTEPPDPRASLRQVIAEAEAGSRRVVVEVGRPPPALDGHLLAHLARELLADAIRRTRSGATIWVGLHDGGRGSAILTVQDDGPGIAASERGQLVGPPGRPSGGDPPTGGPLRIAGLLADLAGGQLTIDDRPGGGVMVTVILPLDSAPPSDLAVAPTRRQPRLRALLVHDDPTELVSTADLAAAFRVVATATGAEEAWAALRTLSVDAVLIHGALAGTPEAEAVRLAVSATIPRPVVLYLPVDGASAAGAAGPHSARLSGPRRLGRPSQARAAAHGTLTRREQEVLELLAQGLDPTSVAAELEISLNTCRGHVKAILAKLGAHSQLEAVVTAARRGLVPHLNTPPARSMGA